ncbi:MAG: type I secretion C-terminal target domain-containing protein [Uliginosibacterium sp.]|nr:type I secretion C-terminal target domain-containing protein [Uliginosibacterium sp.]
MAVRTTIRRPSPSPARPWPKTATSRIHRQPLQSECDGHHGQPGPGGRCDQSGHRRRRGLRLGHGDQSAGLDRQWDDLTNATTATIAAGTTSVLVRTPVTNDTIDELNETFTLTATTTAGTTSNASAVGTATITDNDPTPSLALTGPATINEGAGTATYTVTLSAASGQTVTVAYGTAGGTATSGVDFTATSGTLTFAPGATVATFSVPITNDSVRENAETYTVSLSSPSNATIGSNVTTTIADNDFVGSGSSTPITQTIGLRGEYFGYNEWNSAQNDTVSGSGYLQQRGDGNYGNLDRIAEVAGVINLRNGAAVVGTASAASNTAADASFTSRGINYGPISDSADGGVGRNPTQLTSGAAVTSGKLYEMLGSDAASLRTTSTFGRTTDALIRFVGQIDMTGGNYDIRVTADDGYRMNIGGNTVASYDNITPVLVTTFANVAVADGLQPIEILYWDQGGEASFKIEVKLSGSPDSSYVVLDSNHFAMFSPTSFPTLGANQEIVAGSTPGQWVVTTGDNVTGTEYNDTLTGTAYRDTLTGGAGNDTLTGGLGSDTFRWQLADKGTTTAPATDTITDFNTAPAATGGDVLNLQSLLSGENHTTGVGNLGSYLHFEYTAGGTIIHVSSTGAYGTGGYASSKDDQRIVVSGVDLTAGGTATDASIIQDLLNKGKLQTD